ncbi:hypothetical protein [Maridesulfovibrio zosterae]|uniref:hypothetical protein n=1 Tax=Maridesulfovibrio zosterae TaxID=82171 RepID=UPI000400D581|nr:hypothetical protein [Maridesulfovibrio zosterae]
MRISLIRKLTVSAFIFTLLLISSTAYAHRVSVFAYVEGDTVYTESYFSKKKLVHQGKIEVFNTKGGKLVLSGITDDDGKYDFTIPAAIKADKSGMKIVLHASEGHRGEWTLQADEIFPEDQVELETIPSSQTPPAVSTNTAISAESSVELSTQIKKLNDKIDTLKRLIISQQENGPGANEIFSGIGYILGLFGVAAFFMSRKR